MQENNSYFPVKNNTPDAKFAFIHNKSHRKSDKKYSVAYNYFYFHLHTYEKYNKGKYCDGKNLPTHFSTEINVLRSYESKKKFSWNDLCMCVFVW